MTASLELVRQFYPNAITSDEAAKQLFRIMRDQLGLMPNQIMHASSLCSDDINEIEYPERGYDMLGPFRMGGLDGFPFTGITGMTAYAGHVPEGGALLIYAGPHIGLSKEGGLGRVKRIGQVVHTSCCGAAAAALEKLKRDGIKEGELTELDYQQNVLEQILLREKQRVLGSDSPIQEATEVIYEAIEERIRALVGHVEFICRYVILTGGVTINGGGTTSYCSFRLLECIDTGKKSHQDYYRFLDFASQSRESELG